VTLVKTSTASKLPEQFARAFDERGRSKAILIVGYSNDESLQLPNDALLRLADRSKVAAAIRTSVRSARRVRDWKIQCHP
jgi:hypothetical protein